MTIQVGDRLPDVPLTVADADGPKPTTSGEFFKGKRVALFAVPGTGASYWTGFFPAVVVLGLGMAITIAPLTTTVMNAVGTDAAGVASGVNNAVSRVAAVLAIAVFGFMAWAFGARLDAGLQQLDAPPEVVEFLAGQRARLAEAALPPGMEGAAADALREQIRAAYVSGFRWIMLASAGLALLSALAAWLLIGKRAEAGTGQGRP